jgi:hypothetical protein
MTAFDSLGAYAATLAVKRRPPAPGTSGVPEP